MHFLARDIQNGKAINGRVIIANSIDAAWNHQHSVANEKPNDWVEIQEISEYQAQQLEERGADVIQIT